MPIIVKSGTFAYNKRAKSGDSGGAESPSLSKFAYMFKMGSPPSLVLPQVQFPTKNEMISK